MKKYLYILILVLLPAVSMFAQDEDNSGNEEQANRMREKLTEYIQKRLNLTKAEAEKFTPVFVRYFNDLRKTSIQNRGDAILRQQKVAELRLRYRDEFKPIIGDSRANRVFVAEREFIKIAKDVMLDRRERLQNRKDNNPRQ
jgi:hypothetical protein